MKRVLVIHGPNLNLLGEREPHLYGSQTLAEINQAMEHQGNSLGLTLAFFQSNHEGEILDTIQKARHETEALILNPGGLTHTSVVLHDTLAAYPHPIVEVHLSNIYKREYFRHHSYVSPVATGIICGLGATGYFLALEALAEKLKAKGKERFYGQ